MRGNLRTASSSTPLHRRSNEALRTSLPSTCSNRDMIWASIVERAPLTKSGDALCLASCPLAGTESALRFRVSLQ